MSLGTEFRLWMAMAAPDRRHDRPTAPGDGVVAVDGVQPGGRVTAVSRESKPGHTMGPMTTEDNADTDRWMGQVNRERIEHSTASRYRSIEERVELGKSIRSRVPRASHAEVPADADRPDPLAFLEEQAADRVPELVPIRHGRMLQSPFA